VKSDAGSGAEQAPKQHEIELEAFEAVASGGMHHVTWQVAIDGRWRALSEIGERLLADERPPGVVWKQRYRLKIGVGTRLMRVESRPPERTRQDPLSYLWRSRPGAERRVRRSYFEVAADGRLTRQEARS
jgi:hypothetical protein